MFRTHSGRVIMPVIVVAVVLTLGCESEINSGWAGSGGVIGISGTGGAAGTGGAVGITSTGGVTGIAGTGGTSVDAEIAGTSGSSGIGAAGGGGVAGIFDGGTAFDGGGTAGSSVTSGTGGMAGSESGSAGSDTGGPSPRSTGCGKSAPTGAFQAEIEAFDLARSYFISVPRNYDPNVPHRLVFGFHGSGYTGQRMRAYLDLEKPPLVDGTIFVYPDGLELPGQPGNTAWELGENQRDIAFFDALYDSIRSTYCIDEERVFANGQSYGGLMTEAVGCLRGNILRAIAVVAGSGPYSTCRGQVAVWITHGIDDTYVPYASGEASRDRWVAANHCASTTTPGNPPQCQNYDGCDGDFPVIWCPHENDGGHQHPSFGRQAVREFLDSF